MPEIQVVLFKEDDGTVPILQWLDELEKKVRAKCIHKIERLKQEGHALRRPECDYLRDDIYELRVRKGAINYRMLYFFHGKVAAVVSHGLVKEQAVPPSEIERAIRRKKRFEQNPDVHAERL